MLCIGPHGDVLPNQDWGFDKCVEKEVKEKVEQQVSKRPKYNVTQQAKFEKVTLPNPNTTCCGALFCFLNVYYSSKREYWTNDLIQQLNNQIRAFQVYLQVYSLYYFFLPFIYLNIISFRFKGYICL